MNGNDSLRNPLKHARGLGSAHSGVPHFVAQRVTAIALVLLSVWLVYLLAKLIGADFAQARALVGHPCNAVLMAAFLVAMFWHGKLGLQVVIEDYVHAPGRAIVCQLIVVFVCAIAALASVLAVVRIALGA